MGFGEVVLDVLGLKESLWGQGHVFAGVGRGRQSPLHVACRHSAGLNSPPAATERFQTRHVPGHSSIAQKSLNVHRNKKMKDPGPLQVNDLILLELVIRKEVKDKVLLDLWTSRGPFLDLTSPGTELTAFSIVLSRKRFGEEARSCC